MRWKCNACPPDVSDATAKTPDIVPHTYVSMESKRSLTWSQHHGTRSPHVEMYKVGPLWRGPVRVIDCPNPNVVWVELTI